MYTFKPASPYTQICFNPQGIKPYDAVLECEIREPNYATYDLTVLDYNDHYKAAHGAVIEPFIFKTLDETKKWLITWYETNKQRKTVTV